MGGSPRHRTPNAGARAVKTEPQKLAVLTRLTPGETPVATTLGTAPHRLRKFLPAKFFLVI